LAKPTVVCATDGASVGFASTAADRCEGSAGLASGIGTGTTRLATCGIKPGGRGTPLTAITGGNDPAGP
jgi:hypothetical protein